MGGPDPYERGSSFGDRRIHSLLTKILGSRHGAAPPRNLHRPGGSTQRSSTGSAVLQFDTPMLRRVGASQRWIGPLFGAPVNLG